MITSIAFVHPDHVIDAITLLDRGITDGTFPVELEPTVQWFTNTYIGNNFNFASHFCKFKFLFNLVSPHFVYIVKYFKKRELN